MTSWQKALIASAVFVFLLLVYGGVVAWAIWASEQ